jgi:hypothetical protein
MPSGAGYCTEVFPCHVIFRFLVINHPHTLYLNFSSSGASVSFWGQRGESPEWTHPLFNSLKLLRCSLPLKILSRHHVPFWCVVFHSVHFALSWNKKIIVRLRYVLRTPCPERGQFWHEGSNLYTLVAAVTVLVRTVICSTASQFLFHLSFIGVWLAINSRFRSLFNMESEMESYEGIIPTRSLLPFRRFPIVFALSVPPC